MAAGRHAEVCQKSYSCNTGPRNVKGIQVQVWVLVAIALLTRVDSILAALCNLGSGS